MDKTEIDKILKSCIDANHRAIFVLKKNTLIPTLYNSLNEQTCGPRPQLIYLYSKKSDTIELKVPDAIDYVNFNESDRILGSTISMLVIQDFDTITPNLLAKSVETVKGGGICCFIVDKLENRIFNNRMLKWLSKSDNTFFCDEHDRLLPKKVRSNKGYRDSHTVTSNSIDFVRIEDADSRCDSQITSVKREKIFNNSAADAQNVAVKSAPEISDSGKFLDIHQEIEDNIKSELLNASKTHDQFLSLKQFDKILTERSFKTICSLTAARGRGKSAVLGLTIALSLHYSFTTINVVAPLLENVKTVFEFAILGLKRLGYQEKVHFDVHYKSIKRNRLVWKITFRKRFLKQQVVFLDPAAPLTYLPDLMVVDEAAAVPLPNLQKLLAANLVILASTVDGYEGTGRALVLKLFSDLEKKSKDPQNPFVFQKQSLESPIRYGQDDPVERWLTKALVLYAQPQKISAFPPIPDCELHSVNAEVLFSGSKTSEVFLAQIVSVLTTSHYKNTPDDLLRMSDDTNSRIFILCPKIVSGSFPTILCVLEIVDEQITNTRNKEGNLTQHCLYENYQINEVLQLIGKRIIRIAVHPDIQRMGYGRHAMRSIIHHFASGMYNDTRLGNSPAIESHFQSAPTFAENTEPNIAQKIHGKNHGERKKSDSLLCPLACMASERCDYISVSFGASNSLISFWKPLGFIPTHVKAHHSPITGEFSSLFVLPFTNQDLFRGICEMFKVKFMLNCSSFYSSMPYTLVFDIFYDDKLQMGHRGFVTAIDDNAKRLLSLFIHGKIEYRHVAHLISILASNFFQGNFQCNLSPIEQSVLLLLGIQHRNFNEIHTILEIEEYKTTAKLLSLVTKLFKVI